MRRADKSRAGLWVPAKSDAFGAYPTRTFIETHRMAMTTAVTFTVPVLAVIAWYTVLATGS